MVACAAHPPAEHLNLHGSGVGITVRSTILFPQPPLSSSWFLASGPASADVSEPRFMASEAKKASCVNEWQQLFANEMPDKLTTVLQDGLVLNC